MADLLHHLAEMRCTTPAGVINNVIDPAERAAFLSRKADVIVVSTTSERDEDDRDGDDRDEPAR